MTNTEDATGRIAACTDGALLDTNVLLLLLIGLTSETLVESCNRTRAYSRDDYFMLRELVHHARHLAVTPHIACETWNLGENALSGEYEAVFKRRFVDFIDVAKEAWLPTRNLCARHYFSRLGVTDSAIASRRRRRPLVITDDFGLYRQLESDRHPVLNFTHLREFWDSGR